MKAIIFSDWFEPKDEFKEFLSSIGYNKLNSKLNSKNFDIMFDQRVVDFCSQRLTNLWNEKVYKGRETYRFRCGFAGAGYVRDIDTTKKWIIKYNQVDAPIITYVDVKVNDYGYLSVVSEDSK